MKLKVQLNMSFEKFLVEVGGGKGEGRVDQRDVNMFDHLMTLDKNMGAGT